MGKSLAVLALILCLGLAVSAIGSGAGGGYPKPNPAKPIPTTTTQPATTPPTLQVTSQTQPLAVRPTSTTAAPRINPRQQDCEGQPTALERISCRLENNVTSPSVPEQCRGIPDTQACVALHDDAKPCYTMPGIEKDKCLRKKAGVEGTLADGLKNNPKGMRLYAVLLNYDLQERIEDAHSQGRVDAYTAAVMIDDIVHIKKALLEGRPKTQVLPFIESLKAQMKNNGVT